jgi:hypothetical protein
MSKESPATRYFRLSTELGKKYDDMLRRLTEDVNRQLNDSINRHLDAMEDAMNKGDLARASYHEFMAKALLGSMVPLT